MARAAGVLATALVASSCTYAFTNASIAATCDPLRYEVNLHDVSLSAAQIDAIHDAVAEFAVRTGRSVEDLGSTAAVAADRHAEDPILIEVSWPDDAPRALGFAEPGVLYQTYVGGWIKLNPQIRHLTVGVLRRLVLHELGHLAGMADVTAPNELMNPGLTTDSWGVGDVVGLHMSHRGGCH